MKHISAVYKVDVETEQHYAWLPIKSDSGKLIWFDTYYVTVEFVMVKSGNRRWLNNHVHTKEEYFLKRMCE